MKMLKLSPYHFPEKAGSSHIGRDLSEAYLTAGFTIENFVPSPSHGVSAEERRKYRKIRYEEKRNGQEIVHRFPMFPEGKNPILRALRYVLVNLIQLRRGSRAEGVDLILSASTPPTQGMMCGLVKKRLSRRYGHKVPFVFLLQDIFPDSLVNAGMAKKGSVLWKIGRRIEDFAYRSADKIIVISQDFKTNIMAKGVPEDKIAVVPNWADTDNVHPVAREDNLLFDRYGLDREKFYISYSGNIGHTQNMSLLLDTAKEIGRELKDVCFVLIGEGAAKAGVEKRIREEAIDNVIVLPFQPYEEISHVFSLGDVGLIISKPGVGNNSVPSKTFGYMAAGKPVLASFDKQSELSSLIETVGCGVTAEAGSREELLDAIRSLAADPQLAEKGRLGQAYISTELDKEKCIRKYLQTIDAALHS